MFLVSSIHITISFIQFHQNHGTWRRKLCNLYANPQPSPRQEYMEGTSTTGDHMLRDPEAWLELDQEARGDTSTKLQVGITSAALALATHLNSFTKSYNKSRISK